MKKKILALLLCAVLVLSILPMAGAAADPVQYLAFVASSGEFKNETCTDYTVITNQTAWGTAGATTWYVASGTVSLTNVTVTGDVHLILLDGCNLTAAAGGSGAPGIQVEGTNSLTIYAQSTGGSMGKLSATGGSDSAGIGSMNGQVGGSGTITINGGSIESTGGGNGAGIGGGSGKNSGTVIINGGSVKAIGGYLCPGIGCGYGGAGGNITINGGTVNAIGDSGAAGIGSTGYGDGDTMTITITGGTVTAVGSTGEMMDMAEENTYYMGGAGIGGGNYYSGGNITISGGTVNATGGNGAAGIGGGSGSPTREAIMGRLMPGESPYTPGAAGGNITISGGSITATGGNGAASIGGGAGATEQGTITLSVTMYDENGEEVTADDLKTATALTMTDVPPVTGPVIGIAGDNGTATSFYPGAELKVAVSIEDVTKPGYAVDFKVGYDKTLVAPDEDALDDLGLTYALKETSGSAYAEVILFNVEEDAEKLFYLPFNVLAADVLNLTASANAVFTVSATASTTGLDDPIELTADPASVTLTIDPGIAVEFTDKDDVSIADTQFVIPGVTAAGSIRVPAAPPAATGYVFTGWSDGTTTYADAAAVQAAAIAITAPVTYKATYQQLYKVNFTDKGGSAVSGSATQYVTPGNTNATLDVPDAPPVAGYVFTGWSDGTNTYADAAAVKVKTIAGDTTYQATYALDVEIAQYVNYVGGYVRVDVTGALSGYAFNGAPMYKTGDNTFSFIYCGADMTTLYGEKMTEEGLVEDLLIGTILSEYTYKTEETAKYDITETPVSDYNVNASTAFDIADVRAVFNCQKLLFSVSDYMPVYLRSDLDGSHEVDGTDVTLIIEELLAD